MPRLETVLPRLASYLPAPWPLFDPAPHPLSATHVWAAVNAALAAHADRGPTTAEQLTDLALADLDETDRHGLPVPTVAAAGVCAVLGVAHGWMSRGDADAARSWLVRGLGGSTAPVTQVDLTGPVELVRLASSGDPAAEDAVAVLAGVLFSLNQHAGYLAEVLDPLAEALVATLLAMPPGDAACQGARAALIWAHHRRLPELVKPLAVWCEDAAHRVGDLETTVALLLAVAITGTGRTRVDMLQALRTAVPHQLPAGLRLQVLIAALEPFPPSPDDLQEALSLIDEHWQQLASADAAPFDSGPAGAADLARLRERTFSTIGPLLTSLSATGGALEVLRVLRHWLGIPDDPTTVDCLLLEHTPEGVRYVWPGGTWLSPPPVDATLLDGAVNAALGTALASSWQPAGRVHTAATGRPDRPSGATLEQACRDELGLAAAPWITAVEESTLLVPVPGHRIPYQALVTEHTQRCPALWTSLRRPWPERWPLTVVLLEGDTDLAAVEAGLVADILRGGGFDVTHRYGSAVTAEGFSAYHRDPSIDVLWLTCHGRQPPYEPGTASLLLREGEVLTSGDLTVEEPDAVEQRLLVLNSCDGAATVTAGGMRARGLAAEAAGPSQAVIGHQWVVAEQLAATFGALLAVGLVEHRTAGAAFTAALIRLRQPWPDLGRLLEEHGARPDLIARLTPPTGSYGDNILDWGAPALYC